MQQLQTQDFFLSANISNTVTTINLTSFKLPDGTAITTALLGGVCYGVLEPGTANEENISFTGVTGNQITGVTRGLDFKSPYTTVAGLRKAHATGVKFRLSNTAPFYNEFSQKANTETITGAKTFSLPVIIPNGTAASHAVTLAQLQAQAAGVFNSATNAIKGAVELSTSAEIDAGTANGASGPLVITPDQIALSKYSEAGQLPTVNQKAALAGTSGAPSSTNKYIVEEDVAENTASKIVRRKSDGNLTAGTPSAVTDVVPKSYADTIDAKNFNKIALITGGVTPSGGAEATTYTFTIPANVLLAGNAVTGKFYCSFAINASFNRIIRIKLNGTTALTLTKPFNNSSLNANLNGIFVFDIVGLTSSSQALSASLMTTPTDNVATNEHFASFTSASGSGTAIATSAITVTITTENFVNLGTFNNLIAHRIY